MNTTEYNKYLKWAENKRSYVLWLTNTTICWCKASKIYGLTRTPQALLLNNQNPPTDQNPPTAFVVLGVRVKKHLHNVPKKLLDNFKREINMDI